MESGPAIFAGTAFALFGAALLLWTGTRALHRRPVAHGVATATGVTFGMLFGAVFLTLAVWCFGRL
ncbi:hypothetical protein ACH46N_31570 [Streptomyces pristinaespiralis]|jgi:hypothetical protein|uniref:Uncharacterized protein n=2 Tax=Streptomyces pristinaespiralis TaxID=38300 RepID=B5HA94_STRE2|nr:hypothetical protein [Streptomyces pristinaespiralis]ALC21816.1 putative membrane protein [Streptomyces pristinaespiralis]EDY63755.1 conserved hypothetical protein [Streptomyces pristinaespiralis ATCC 25486]QMU15501.1 hypothetical protein H3L99_19430 [Streptomyces pristinaespiralis]